VGKSSVINRILQRKNFARVGEKPGKTVHINYFTIDKKCYFVDLPGYGYAKVSQSDKKRWADLVEGYLMSDRDIRLIIQLVDSRHAPTKDDVQMINFMIDNEVPFIIALTKCDKLNKTERQKRAEAFLTEIPCFDQITSVWTSTTTFEGISDLKEIFEELSSEDYEFEYADEESEEDFEDEE
jgi:GTP-binding protein